jgi:hypothetical protein
MQKLYRCGRRVGYRRMSVSACYRHRQTEPGPDARSTGKNGVLKRGCEFSGAWGRDAMGDRSLKRCFDAVAGFH